MSRKTATAEQRFTSKFFTSKDTSPPASVNLLRGLPTLRFPGGGRGHHYYFSGPVAISPSRNCPLPLQLADFLLRISIFRILSRIVSPSIALSIARLSPGDSDETADRHDQRQVRRRINALLAFRGTRTSPNSLSPR